MKKTSDLIKEIRALVNIKADERYYKQLDGEQIPNILTAYMSAINTERQLEHARIIVEEFYELIDGSMECGIDPSRKDEIAGLLLLWKSEHIPAQ